MKPATLAFDQPNAPPSLPSQPLLTGPPRGVVPARTSSRAWPARSRARPRTPRPRPGPAPSRPAAAGLATSCPPRPTSPTPAPTPARSRTRPSAKPARPRAAGPSRRASRAGGGARATSAVGVGAGSWRTGAGLPRQRRRRRSRPSGGRRRSSAPHAKSSKRNRRTRCSAPDEVSSCLGSKHVTANGCDRDGLLTGTLFARRRPGQRHPRQLRNPYLSTFGHSFHFLDFVPVAAVASGAVRLLSSLCFCSLVCLPLVATPPDVHFLPSPPVTAVPGAIKFDAAGCTTSVCK